VHPAYLSALNHIPEFANQKRAGRTRPPEPAGKATAVEIKAFVAPSKFQMRNNANFAEA
jgi:hypothetical protein